MKNKDKTKAEREKYEVKNISECKKIEDELRLYTAMMDNIAEGINLICLDDLLIKWTNEKFARMFGYNPGEMVGKHVDILNAPTKRTPAEVRISIMDTLKKSGEWHGEIKNVKRDGTCFWCYASISLFEHPNYSKVGVSVHTDITEQKQAEDKLRKSERNLIESQRIGKIGNWEWIPAENKLIWSTEMYTIFGITPETSLTTEMAIQAFHPEDRAMVVEATRKTLEELKPQTIEGRILKPDGTINYVYGQGEVMLDTNGKLIKMIGIYQDITERKKAEIDLAESEEKYRTVFENTGTATIIVEEDMTISMANRQFEQLSGYSKEEIENKMKWTKLVIPEDLERMKEYHLLRRKEKGSPPTVYEFSIRDKWGGIKNIWLKIGMIPGTKKSVASLTDITARKTYEGKLKKSMEDVIYTIGKISEIRDPYTSGHQLRVSQLSTAIAQEMKLPFENIEGIRIASLVHDIGKISIPSEILSKPSNLSELEFSLIKNHAQIGYDLLKSIEFPWPIAQIVLQHHESLNGSGYPQGLKGDNILPEAKIIAVADVVEAMSSHRPYRPALGIDKALEEISENKGILYDPKVVDACISLFREKDFKF